MINVYSNAIAANQKDEVANSVGWLRRRYVRHTMR